MLQVTEICSWFLDRSVMCHRSPRCWAPSAELKLSQLPLRESKCSQHPPPPTDILQDGLQVSKSQNISIINYALNRSMICPACFTTPGFITINLIQTKKPGRADGLSWLNNPREDFHQVQRTPCLSPQLQNKGIIEYNGFLLGGTAWGSDLTCCSSFIINFSLFISAENSLITWNSVLWCEHTLQ